MKIDRYIFADESGCLEFSKKGSKYFMLCTVCTTDPKPLSDEITQLKRALAMEGLGSEKCLHATTDVQAVRDAVFERIAAHDFRVDVTILEKTKALPRIRKEQHLFYKYAWYYHFKYVGPQTCSDKENVFICAAAIGAKKKRNAFREAVNDVVTQSFQEGIDWKTAFWPADSDPWLLIADYCAWAVQRKWELEDDRSYVLIKDKIETEFDLWSVGSEHHYEL